MNWMAKVFIVINLIFCLVSNASATIINLPGSIFITDENLVHQVFNQEKILFDYHRTSASFNNRSGIAGV